MNKKDEERLNNVEREGLDNCKLGRHCLHDFDMPPIVKHRRMFLNHGSFMETDKRWICCWCGHIQKTTTQGRRRG